MSHHMIHMTAPAEDFTEALLVGNGSLGAAVHGGPDREVMDLNVDTLWSGGPVTAAAAPVTPIDELRAAIARGDVAETERLAIGLQSDGYAQTYLPLGRLTWRWSRPGAAGDYRRELDLRAAETRTRVGDSTCAVFVSAVDDVLVATTDDETAIGDVEIATALVSEAHVEDDERGVRWHTVTGRAPVDVVPPFVESAEPVTYAGDDPAMAPDADGTVAAGMGWALVVASAPEPGGGRRLVAAATSGFRGWNERPSADVDVIAQRARAKVAAALAMDTARLRARHRADHAALFDRVELDLAASEDPSALVAQRQFDLGRYLLISSSRPGTQAATLQGIWNDELRAPWGSAYTTNINLQMNYWGAHVAGLTETTEPLFDLIGELADAGTATARDYYRANGTAAHHNSDIWRASAPVAGRTQWANWQFALAWLALHLGDRLDFDWSDEFAARVALPVLRRVSAFVLDNLVASEGEDLVVSPSSSPEHEFRAGELTGAVSHGSAIDQELARETLRRTLELARVCGDDDELIDRVARALPLVREPHVDAFGHIAEWERDYESAEPGHRHVSHLIGLFPGARISPVRTPDQFEAVRRSLADRIAHGGGHTGWSQTWILCLAARLGDAGLATQALEILTGELSSSSLLDLHPFPWRPSGTLFQIDGNLGVIAGVAELLLQSHDGAVSLLPTLPPAWRAGQVRGMRARGGVTVDIKWRGGALIAARLRPDSDGPIVLELAAGRAVHVSDGAGDPVVTVPATPAGPGRARLRWSGRAGMPYDVRVVPAP